MFRLPSNIPVAFFSGPIDYIDKDSVLIDHKFKEISLGSGSFTGSVHPVDKKDLEILSPGEISAGAISIHSSGRDLHFPDAGTGLDQESLVSYEPFNYQIGPLSGKDCGDGFSDPWVVYSTEAEDAPKIVNSPLVINGDSKGLLVDGKAVEVSTGLSIVSGASRSLDLSILGSEFITNIGGEDHIWSEGRTIYCSFLMMNAVQGGRFRIGLTKDSATAFSANLGREPIGSPLFYLDTLDPVLQTPFLIPSLPDNGGETLFVVMEISFGATEDIIKYYINPATGSKPVSPKISWTSGFQSARFNGIKIEAAEGGKSIFFDEFRIGDTYKSVTPSSPKKQSYIYWKGDTYRVKSLADRQNIGRHKRYVAVRHLTRN